MTPRTIQALFAAAALLASSPLRAAQAGAPQPDFTRLPAYIAALDRARDPQAVAIRREIAGGPAALARAQAAARAAGISLTAPAPTVVPDQNAAPLFDQWYQLRSQRRVVLPDYAEALSSAYAYTPEQLARAQRVIDDNPAVFALLHTAASKPDRFYTDAAWTRSAQVREAARELRTEGYLRADRGQYADAVTDGALGLNLAKQDAPQAGLVDYLVDDALESSALNGLQETLLSAGPNAAVDAQVQQAVQAALPLLSLRQALTGEVAAGVSEINALRSGTPQDLVEAAAAPGTKVSPALPATFTPSGRRFVADLLDATEAAYLTRMQMLIAAAGQPNLRAAFAAVQDTPDAGSSPTDALDPLLSLLRILTPTYGTLDRLEGQRLAREQVTLAAAAVLAVRARTGAFPDVLLGGFTDPFTGTPLIYRREGGGGFVVYSIGPDGLFGGGTPGQSHFDIPQTFFRYPGPLPQPIPAGMLK